jgi:hypothetical protein
MRQQVPHGDVAADRVIPHAELGQVAPHRRREVDFALLDQAHHHGRRKRLRDRSNRKHRVVGDRQRILDVGDAETTRRGDAILVNAERDAGDAVFGHLALRKRDKRLKLRVLLSLRRRRSHVHRHRDTETQTDYWGPLHGDAII